MFTYQVSDPDDRLTLTAVIFRDDASHASLTKGTVHNVETASHAS